MRSVSIRELTESISTWNPSRDPAAEFAYIDLSSVDNATKKVTGARSTIGAEAPSRARQAVAAGDVLVSTVRPNLNAVAVVPPELDGATASTGFTVLRPAAELDGRYLFHWVRSPAFINEMVRKATGASYPAVSDRLIKESKIPAPLLSEQRRITAILDHADALRTKRRQVLDNFDALNQSIFEHGFSGTVWPKRPLSATVAGGTLVTYGIVQAGDEVEGGVPYIRTGDIVGGEIVTTGLRRTDPAIAARFERSTVRAGDIVMSIRATVGTTALVPSELDGANLTQGTARISPGELVTGPFLLAYLRSEAVQRWIQRQVKGATFREITLARLRELPVPLVPISEQMVFAEQAAAVDQQKLAARRGWLQFEELFSSLQSRAFRGEL